MPDPEETEREALAFVVGEARRPMRATNYSVADAILAAGFRRLSESDIPERDATPDEAFELGKTAGYTEGWNAAHLSESGGVDLDAIRKRAEAASPGPWSMWNPAEGPSHLTIGGKVAWESKRSASEYGDTERIPHWSDANFIAHARTDIPALLAEVERLRLSESETPGRFNVDHIHEGDGSYWAGCRRCSYDKQDNIKPLPATTKEADRGESK